MEKTGSPWDSEPAAGMSETSAPAEAHCARITRRTEEVIFACLMFALIISGLVPIVSRSVPILAASWADALTRHLVLWIALFGAIAATHDRKHIAIDLARQFLSERAYLATQAVTQLIAAVTCVVLCRVSLSFVQGEAQYNAEAIAFFGLHEWWLTLALPIGFGLLALRLLIAATGDGVRFITFRRGTSEASCGAPGSGEG